MQDQELKEIWKSSSAFDKISMDMNEMVKSFKSGMEAREGIVRKRDTREIIAATIGMFGFAYTFYDLPNLISRIGSVLGIISLFYIIYKLRSNRKSKFSKELFIALKEQLRIQKKFMANQVRLLNSVLYWMSIPLFTANALIIWGISKSDHSLGLIDQIIFKWEMKALLTLIIAAFFGYLAWRNKIAARINWSPLEEKIDTILKNFKKE